MKNYQRIVIMARPREATGFYEYFVRKRKFFRGLFEGREARLFMQALQRIASGENPSGWVLTRPSPKDKGIELAPFDQSSFVRWDPDLYYFPNERIREAWLEYHWKEYQLTESAEERMMGRPVLLVTGINYSDDCENPVADAIDPLDQ